MYVVVYSNSNDPDSDYSEANLGNIPNDFEDFDEAIDAAVHYSRMVGNSLINERHLGILDSDDSHVEWVALIYPKVLN